jgi:hypothetical protein
VKKVAIVQSNYIPWKGYFDLIASVDEFVLYDDMQFTRRDWRNRNLIKTAQGLKWLTVPVVVKGRFEQPIRETRIQEGDWARVHLNSFRSNYARAACFSEVFDLLTPAYEERHDTISTLNRRLIELVCSYLGITTRISHSWDYASAAGRSERLADICAQAGATVYVSGPAARAYLDEGVFAARGIKVEWFDYNGYPQYPQLWTGFEHGVSIVDLLFNCGSEAPRFMKHVAGHAQQGT